MVIPLISREGRGGIVRLIIGIIGRFAIGMSFHSMILWTTELYPTTTRSTAMGVMEVAGRVGAASSPWIVMGLKSYGDWVPFTVMGVCAVTGVLAGYKLRETKDEELMEVMEMDRRVSRVSTLIAADVRRLSNVLTIIDGKYADSVQQG